MEILGIDVGGSGIKGAIVDSKTGRLLTERLRIPTPRPATPDAVAAVVAQLVHEKGWQGPIGCGFPAAIQHGRVRTAANIDPGFLDLDLAAHLADATGCPVYALNDADAAGMTETRFGAAKDFDGVVLMVTIGTGLGTALFSNGTLMPNTELGHIYLRKGVTAENHAAGRVRKDEGLSWSEWGDRFNRALQQLEALLWPDLILLGGGASKKFDRFADRIDVRAEVKPAQTLNEAGIVGAAVHAAELAREASTR
ncbi:MAG: ROK family protein [Pseudomonadota bacterium]